MNKETSMKLLIVDDEDLTRTGLIRSIDWDSLGIEEVLQADDGLHGLEQARLHRPEIVLCDVRMPRMDGISMLERLEKLLPDSVPIFMSGYSDKEYLKAAIRLKAVNYIEKPLNLSEVRQAVEEAKHLYLQKLHSRRGETLKSMETASRLSLLLTLPSVPDPECFQEFSRELGFTLDNSTVFLSLIIRTDGFPDPGALEKFHRNLLEFLKKRKLHFIYTDRKHQSFTCFLLSQKRPSAVTLLEIRTYLEEQLLTLGRFSAALGEEVCGLSNAYHSYASAVILLQSSFFFPENTLLTHDMLKEQKESEDFPIEAPEIVYRESLKQKDQERAMALLALLRKYIARNTSLFQNSVRDFYYKLFLALDDAEKQLQLPEEKASQTIADTIDSCFTFDELHQVLLNQTEYFFDSALSGVQENPIIHKIKNYIGRHYGNETLSVKDISEHVFLSASYVCTFFKNETGQTLNQYITEYRMKKACQLLTDARYRISDISSRVGYSDGNYFGKSFKKFFGVSPSEYREQNLK